MPNYISLSALSRVRKPEPTAANNLRALLTSQIVGQPAAVDAIVPCVQMYQAGLNPDSRPAGVFLLLGPSGTGKTKTVEALAAALHGCEKAMLKVDCAEFQMEHEVAKLIGAPPGYLGHKETQPMLTQARLSAVTSENSSLSIVLFDEIEKAAPTLWRLLLGVLDKGILRLGDNTAVNFERSIIFLTSNLGSKQMLREMNPDFGFSTAVGGAMAANIGSKLDNIGRHAVRSRFSPEFVNRIDNVVTYRPLGNDDLSAILTQQIHQLRDLILTRFGPGAFSIDITESGRKFLLEKGTSAQYGARELKRTLHCYVVQPIAAMVVEGGIAAGAVVSVERNAEGTGLTIALVKRPMRSRRGAGSRAFKVA
jgi:ATP-dependent Clp protease ATP-binding subunit ClpA